MKIEKGIEPNEIAKMLAYSYNFFNIIISKENFELMLNIVKDDYK